MISREIEEAALQASLELGGPKRTVDQIDPINVEIASAVAAKVLILDDAQDKVMGLDWSWAIGKELKESQMVELFYEPCYFLVNKIARSPLKVLGANDQVEGDKWPLDPERALCLINSPIDPERATFIRDWLCVNVTGLMAVRLDFNEPQAQLVEAKIIIGNKGFGQAMGRIQKDYSRR